MTAPSSVCLVVLDGWGLAPDGPGNAVSLADTPVFDDLWARFGHTTLTACGGAVGLPDGQMGNSEVGHLNLGAGAVVKQDLTLIDEAARLPAFGANAGAAGGAAGHAARACRHARLRRRRALEHGPPPRAAAHGGRGRCRGPRHPRLHRRARHAAARRRDVPRDARGLDRRGRRGARRERRRALLRDGPRQPLGARAEGLRPARPRASASTARRPRAPRRAPPTSAARPTSSSRRPWSARRARSAPRTRSSPSTSGPTACASCRVRWPSRSAARSSAAAWRRSRATRR